eukprot:GFUD01017316.1.p1 GENE.GFUD01017316.1~~GFUD01017316.1.p1  ORF type:complete len:314 (+),score=68.46 GFUD01017316.1:88-1029(+)
MATLVQQEGAQGYLQAQQEVFNQSENEKFNFAGFLDQVNFLEQSKVEMLANTIMYRNETPEQGGSLDNNEWSYQIRVNDSFNKGKPDHSYNEQLGYNPDLSGYNHENEYNTETVGYNNDNTEYNHNSEYNYNGVGYNHESHGLFESEFNTWSPQSKVKGPGFQTLQDLINTSNAEDIPFTDDDFPTLCKDPVKSRPRSENNWASGWAANQRNRGEQNSDTTQVGTNPGQVEANPQISFQWMENEFENGFPIPKEVEPLPTMSQTHQEARPVPIFNQFFDSLQDSEKFQLPLFTPPEPNYFSQSVASWNSRDTI